ncbi:hypothetical protein CHS0354_000278 [Potamilus streckersoni]|uniref:Uncharacterized protein n=1 Tax=Potamilus streckersoni TaxID=2493646 RepID=A0AAE0RYY2_9BIVA|nr:hypothetical protein CHS0354_000278 [Potamilus streckersoni]
MDLLAKEKKNDNNQVLTWSSISFVEDLPLQIMLLSHLVAIKASNERQVGRHDGYEINTGKANNFQNSNTDKLTSTISNQEVEKMSEFGCIGSKVTIHGDSEAGVVL